MTPWPNFWGGRDARWAIAQGDSLAVLRSLPDACVDAVITDPPYSSGGQYRGDRTRPPGEKYVLTGTLLERPDFAGDGRDQRSFAYWVALWLSEALRVAKPGAPLCVFTDWRQLPSTTDAIQAGGWVWRGLVPWDKTEAIRPAMGRFAAQCEWLAVASPAGDAVPDSHMTRLFADNEDRDVLVWGSAGGMPTERGVGCLHGVFRVPLDLNDKHHMTGKPVALMQKVNAICAPGGVILDPFAGSSSTGVAALRDGYRFIGIEKTDAYAALSRERLTAEAAGMPYGAKAQRRGQLTLVG